ncbi:MAG: hypothetical protein H0W24_02445 [Lysobacter sp.]|nr:hypothetical protein [Lysobacter sp.]
MHEDKDTAASENEGATKDESRTVKQESKVEINRAEKTEQPETSETSEK